MTADENLTQLSFERFHPTADGSRCRLTQPDNRLSLGSSVEEWEEVKKEPEGSRTT